MTERIIELPEAEPATLPKPAYSIVDVTVSDPSAFAAYVKGHWDTVEKYGGKFLVASEALEVVEGNWAPRKVVVHQWPSAEAFHRWHDSEDYRPWKEMRHRAARANVILVEGLEG